MGNLRQRKLFKYAVDLFIELLQQVTKQKKNIKCNDADVLCFNKFVEHFGGTIGEEFVRKFAEFGFNEWFPKDQKINYGSQIRFNWIFSQKMIVQWERNSIATNVYFTRKGLKKEHKINVIKHKNNINELLNTLIKAEEKQKALYLNKKKGFPWCIANTSLFFHKSSNCAVCEFKNDCKDVLKAEYPKVYKVRGYGE